MTTTAEPPECPDLTIEQEAELFRLLSRLSGYGFTDVAIAIEDYEPRFGQGPGWVLIAEGQRNGVPLETTAFFTAQEGSLSLAILALASAIDASDPKRKAFS